MTISSQTRKAGPYSGTGSTGPFSFSFKVFEASDLLVVKVNNSTNVETTLVLTTDYTVSLNADQNANPGGTITLVSALAVGYNMVIGSQVPYLQETDLTNQGGFYPEVITDALDKLTIESQQLKEAVDRAAKLPITSQADADKLSYDIERIAESADNLDTVANNIASVNTTAGSITNVNTTAGSIANVNTVGTNIAAVNNVSTNMTKVSTVSTNIASVNTVSGIAANVTTVAGISGNVTTVATNNANVTTVAGSIANVNNTGGSIANVNTVAGQITPTNNIATVAGKATDISTVAGVASSVSTVAGISSNVTSVAGNATNINTVAGQISPTNNISTVAGKAADISTVAGISGSVSTVAGISSAVSTVSSINSAVSTVATNNANVSTVAGSIANVNTTATNISNVNAVAGNATNINAVNANSANINTVAGINSSVTTVAGISSSVVTAAANSAAITNFSSVYLGGKSVAPTVRNDGSALVTGDMYFSTVTQMMQVWNGSAWQAIGSTVNGTAARFKYVATAGQTTFSGNDANGKLLAYDAGYIDVYLNGAHLDPSDYTASNGTSIVLGVAASASDELYIVAFGTFTLSAVISQVGGTNGAAQIPVGTTAQRPTAATGELRFNSSLGKFEGYNGSSWSSVGGGATGGGADAVFVENDKVVTTNYTITSGKNAMSAGPITINDGVTVTIPDGSVWTLV